MKQYLHDGSLDGFLTAVAAARRDATPGAEISATGRAEADLFSAPVRVDTDPAARALLEEVARMGGPDAARRVVYLYYSDAPRAGALALAWLDLLERLGPRAAAHLTHPAVRETLALTRRVGVEIHRMQGLLRFAEAEPPYLAATMTPDHNILFPLALYFRRRLGAQHWLIVDARRRRAADWDGHQLAFAHIETAPAAGPDPYEDLWRTFYRAVAVPGRTNPNLRRQFMPQRYWNHLTEMQEDR